MCGQGIPFLQSSSTLSENRANRALALHPVLDEPPVARDMNSPWESSLAAQAFKAASRSPLIDGQIKKIDRFAKMSEGEIAEWQEARWQKWRRSVRATIPYYKTAAYDEADLASLPVLSKDTLRHNPSSLRNPLVPARSLPTGGTGGQPVPVHISYSSYFTEWGYIAYAWRSGGVSLTDPKITFRGGSLGRAYDEGRGYDEGPVAYQRTYNQILVSPFHLNEDVYLKLLGMLDDFPVKAIWGYPSAIAMFAQWVQRNGPFRQLKHIRTVLLASESAFEWQMRLFEDVFGARIIRWYGMTEKSVFAVECEYRQGYHAVPSYGISEVVDGRIVGTGFTNRAMPLIRYDTEDMGMWEHGGCQCGLPFPRLTNIATKRDRTFLFGYGDKPISIVALNFHDPIFSAFANFQFRQTEAGRVALLLVPAGDGENLVPMAQKARDAMQHRIGDNCRIELEVVPHAELLSERGKLMVVDQRYKPTSAEP
jgi:phenylacetate-CoA ligase